MLDIVIDTNVFMHAGNPKEKRFAASNCLIEKMYACSTLLCIDEGFELEESKNSSHIGHEFLENLPHGSCGFTLIVHLASNCRLKFLPRKASVQISRKINQLIAKRSDRIFLNVACNSSEKYLVSHDYKDFQKPKREIIKKEIQVSVVEAQDCTKNL